MVAWWTLSLLDNEVLFTIWFIAYDFFTIFECWFISISNVSYGLWTELCNLYWIKTFSKTPKAGVAPSLSFYDNGTPVAVLLL